MFRLSIIIGKCVIYLLRVAGRGGSALPGLVIEKLNPRFLEKLAEEVPEGIVLITGSNGKTTTTKVLTAIYRAANKKVLTNKTGSNFRRGIIAATLEQADWSGGLAVDVAVLEVDEGHAPLLAEKLKPKLVIALNVFRDQLDRYGEIDATATKIEDAAQFAEHIVVNSDDPSFQSIRTKLSSNKVSTFGATTALQELLPHDAMLHQTVSKLVNNNPTTLLENVVVKDDVQVLKMRQNGKKLQSITTQLSGIYNAINIAAVLEAIRVLGLDLNKAIATISAVEPAFGRGEVIDWKGRRVLLQLVKNPAGFNQIITALQTVESDCLIILINDQIADGRDVSWLWDVSIRNMKQWQHQPAAIITGGSRAYDMAIRLKYENIEAVPETNLAKIFTQLNTKSKNVTIIATYTAMLETRKVLVKNSVAEEFWK